MTLRIGLAGLGVHGRRYADHLLNGDVPRARLTAISRAQEDLGRRYAEQNGLHFFKDPLELATTDVCDAVVLVLPPDRHPEVATACVNARRPVLVEKPLAPDPGAAAKLATAVRSSGSFLMVGQTLRFDPLVRALRRESTTLGECRSLSINQRFEPSERGWLDHPRAGGLILNTGIHGFDLIRFLTGLEPSAIYAVARRQLTRQTEDQFSAIVELGADGCTAVIDNARSTGSRSGRIEWIGTDGQLWADHVHRTFHRVRGGILEDLGPIEPSPTIPRVLRSFVTSVLDDLPAEVPVEDGVAAVEMVAAAQQSAEKLCRIELKDVRSC